MDLDGLVALMRRLATRGGRPDHAGLPRPLTSRSAARVTQAPVTEADEAADAVIAAGLRAAHPDIPLITEEQAASHALSAKTFLIVDPLDGTKEFVQRRGDFTVNIAYVPGRRTETGRRLRTRAGAPVLDSGVWRRGRGNRRIRQAEMPGPVKPLHVSTPDNTALMVVASKSHRDAATDAYIAKVQRARHDQRGIQPEVLSLVATGEADLYPRLGRTMEWDTAAGDAVLRAAGGQVVRFDDHTPLTYGKPGWDNPLLHRLGPRRDLKA